MPRQVGMKWRLRCRERQYGKRTDKLGIREPLVRPRPDSCRSADSIETAIDWGYLWKEVVSSRRSITKPLRGSSLFAMSFPPPLLTHVLYELPIKLERLLSIPGTRGSIQLIPKRLTSPTGSWTLWLGPRSLPSLQDSHSGRLHCL